jgi:DNA-binding NtrC family response regulator
MATDHRPQDPATAKVLLVVDDEFLIRWSLRQYLVAAGYQVIEAATMAAAREAFAHGVDLVLLDLFLPDGKGLDLLDEFRVDRPASPVIVVSAHGTAELAEQAHLRGAYDFLDKPFDLEVVAAAVGRAARAPDSREQGA